MTIPTDTQTPSGEELRGSTPDIDGGVDMHQASPFPGILPSTTGSIAARQPDLLFEALASGCGIDWHRLTPAARGQLNAACRDLKAAGFTPSEVTLIAQAYRLEMPGMPCTPSALAKHAPRLRGGGAPRLPKGADAVLRAVR